MAFFKSKQTADQAPKKKKSVAREWIDAGLFAIVAATLIRTLIFEAYTIPTGSMEGSMLVNDFLFVSKLSYGPRAPMTPLAVPLVHNTVPIFNTKSYIESVQWKYRRLPGFGNVERNDVVVFNYPAGDTVLEKHPADDYYTILRDQFGGDRTYLTSNFKLLVRPVDKKENYIKRCVAIPGDVLELKDAILYINGKPGQRYAHQKLWYTIEGKSASSVNYLNDNEIEQVPPAYFREQFNNVYFLENQQAEALAKMPGTQIKPFIYPKGLVNELGVFPHDTAHYKFNRDNFGPITIPAAGTTVTLTPENIALYRRIIRNYEGNKLDERDGKIYINDKEATSYTFKMNYYWMMGDNRNNSLDSRYWGFVPDDHIVGKAWFVWFSFHKEGLFHGLRLNRIFRTVHSLEN